MLCYAMLYYTILYYTILYYTILYYTIYHTMEAMRADKEVVLAAITAEGVIIV